MQPVPAPHDAHSFAHRGTLVAGAFSAAIGRSLKVGVLAAGVAGGATVLVAPDGVPSLVVLALAIVVAVVAGGVTAVLVMPAAQRRAFETFSWLGHREVERFRARTGSSVPATPETAAAWLDDHPRSPATAAARIELLTILGRATEAADEITLLASPASDIERVEQAGLRDYASFVATGEPDHAALDELLVALDPTSAAALEATVARAIGETRARLDRGDPDWTAPSVAVRPRLGREAFVITLRDTWSKSALAYAFVGLVVGGVVELIRPA